MAEKLAGFPGRDGVIRRNYPWDEWLDGSVWKLTQADLPTTTLFNFQAGSTLRQAAAIRGMRVRTRLSKDGNNIVIQAYKP